MTLCEILAKDTYWLIYGDFLKFGGLVVLSATTLFKKCPITDFPIFLVFLCARAIILKVGKFSLQGMGCKISWNIWLFHGAGGEVYSITFLP